jgi:hypothetical protein
MFGHGNMEAITSTGLLRKIRPMEPTLRLDGQTALFTGEVATSAKILRTHCRSLEQEFMELRELLRWRKKSPNVIARALPF